MSDTVKILVECPALIASVKVGVLDVLSVLEGENKCEVIFKETVNIKKEDIMWCDIVVCVRGCEFSTLYIMKLAKKFSRFIIYFLDDDLLNVPQNLECSEYFKDANLKKNLIEIISISDALWCVNNLLLKKYSKYCSKNNIITKVPTVLENYEKNTKETINILYAGSVDHSGIIRQYVVPAVIKLCNDFGDRISFTFIGANPNIRGFNNIKYIKYIDDYSKYKELVVNGNFHIGLAPVYTEDFYKCKYYNKFIEYTSINAVGIYTNSEPYVNVISNNKNGFLCENTEEDWYNTIKKVILDNSMRESCLINARKLIFEEFNPKTIAEKMSKDLPEITGYYADKKNDKFIKFRNMKYMFYRQRIKILFKQNGVLVIPIIVYKIIKKITKKILI
ncbi:hypothetical protein ACWTV9_14920 [Clostridioides difficile]